MFNFILELGSIPSRLLNVFTGGTADLSTSARSHRDELGAEKWIDRLFFFQRRHCEWAWNKEVERSRENVRRDEQLKAKQGTGQ